MSEGGGRWWLLGGGGKRKPPSKTCVHACVRGWWEVVVARWWWQMETTLENEHTHTLVLEGGSAKWGLVSAKTKQMKSMQAYLCTRCDLSSWSVSGSWSVCKGMVEWEGWTVSLWWLRRDTSQLMWQFRSGPLSIYFKNV